MKNWLPSGGGSFNLFSSITSSVPSGVMADTRSRQLPTCTTAPNWIGESKRRLTNQRCLGRGCGSRLRSSRGCFGGCGGGRVAQCCQRCLGRGCGSRLRSSRGCCCLRLIGCDLLLRFIVRWGESELVLLDHDQAKEADQPGAGDGRAGPVKRPKCPSPIIENEQRGRSWRPQTEAHPSPPAVLTWMVSRTWG